MFLYLKKIILPGQRRSVADDHIDPDNDDGKEDKEYSADQKGDKLRGPLGRCLRRLGYPKGIDKGVGEKEKWFHNIRKFV